MLIKENYAIFGLPIQTRMLPFLLDFFELKELVLEEK